jgi:hypothetical protein
MRNKDMRKKKTGRTRREKKYTEKKKEGKDV